MKCLSLLIISSILLLGSIACKKNSDSGIVAHYTFNGDASDYSAYGNHGQVYGAILTSDRSGNKNSAYFFDGTTAYIEAMVSDMPAVGNPQTISLWFKIDQPPAYKDSLGADNMIALVDTSAGIGVQFGFRAAGYHSLGLDTWYWGGSTVLESQQPTLNAWHHCVYTYNGQSHFFYLDGRQVAKSEVKAQVGTPDMLMLGNYPGGDQFFAGSLDDVRIYKRFLLPTEIDLLYNKKE